MADLSYENLLLVCLIGAVIPLGLGLLPRMRLPSVVLEIAAGVILGPAVLGWIEVDPPVAVLSWLGLTFLLFLAGLEIDPAHLRGGLVRSAGLGYLLSLAIGLPIALVLAAVGWVDNAALLAIILASTALGLIVPVVRDAGEDRTAFGQSVIVGGTVADIAAIILLSVLFGAEGDTASRSALLLSYGVLLVVLTIAVGLVGRLARLRQVLAKLADTTAQIRIRLAVVLLVALTALAARFGLETILGAFLAGVVLSVLNRRQDEEPQFRPKLDAVGFGLLIPVFYVTTGLQLDLRGLLADEQALLRVPVFLLALLLVRGVPALLFARAIGLRRAIAAGLLQATSLPFIVAATQVGLSVGLLSAVSAAALVTAGILSVAIFPLAAFGLLRAAPQPSPLDNRHG